mmetsp:Transcript_32320/g.85333  ORF Transcript_32320/g.85333 Transcript_32320/m.85333 type:complete len:85 (-) Transcript_32320:63-317(-)
MSAMAPVGGSDGAAAAASSSAPTAEPDPARPSPETREEEEEEKFQESLGDFFDEFHRHIFNPVLLRLAALEIRKDLSDVPKGPF